MAKKQKKLDKRTKEYKELQAKKEALKEQLKGTSAGNDLIKYDEEQSFQLETSVEDSKLRMAILEHMPEDLLKIMYEHVKCECTLKAYEYFNEKPFPVSRILQRIINRIYHELFNERVPSTSCTDCMKRRIKRIRVELETRINQ